MLFFFWLSTDYTLKAWMTWERYNGYSLDGTIRPARTAMPIGAFFLLVQGIAEFRCAMIWMIKRAQTWTMRMLPVYVVALAVIFIETFFPNMLPAEMVFGEGMDASLRRRPLT